MFDPIYCCFIIVAVTVLGHAQEGPRIVSLPETVGVYSGQTAVLKCLATNLGNKLLRWSSLTHGIAIYETDRLLTSDTTKYSMKYISDGRVQSLQISNVDKFDQGFYQCEIDGTDQKIIIHLDVIDVPNMVEVEGPPPNLTDCCVAENMTQSCLPACNPSQIDLNMFDPVAMCSDVSNIRGLSKCFTAGSNHDNCCLTMKVDPICIGFCHNDVSRSLSTNQVNKCFTDSSIRSIFTCFQMGFEFLPSEPTDVSAIALHTGNSGSILVKWSAPLKNPQKVTGYRILFKSRTESSYSWVIIKDSTARSYRLNGDTDKIKNDMDYKIRVSAVADHGVSFGSVEVDIYVPARAVPRQLNIDIDTCCSVRGVEKWCRNQLCHSKTWSQFNTDHILTCFPYLNDIFTCLVGTHDQTNCCAAFDVTSDCLPLCSGQPPPLNTSLIGCVSQMSIIEACVQQGNGSLPTPPTQVTIAFVETTSAIIKFEQSSSIGVTNYLVGLRAENENAPFIYNITVDISSHNVYLNNLNPNTYYWVRIVSVGEQEDSLPSETVSFLTYPETYDVAPESVTNLPHNITECCINSKMPEVCWRGCEYRSNITSYYSTVLADCFLHIGSVLTCAADGRDHTECCRSRGVNSQCFPLCAFTTKGPLDSQYIECVKDTSIAIMCFQEGIVNLPRHPDVVVSNVSKNSISLKWQQPKTSGRIDSYLIIYGITDSKNKSQLSTNKTFYILQDLEQGTSYDISVTSLNSNGTSAPSPVITQRTLNDNIPVPTSNVTEVSERAFWQNISHCCENSVGKECLDQCLNTQTAHPQQTTCILEASNMLACYADGKDYMPCCKERGLPSTCIPICGGRTLTTDITMATCMSYAHREIVLSCYIQRKGLIPSTPGNFGAMLVGTEGSVKLQWSPSGNCLPLCTYGVHYWQVGDDSSITSIYNITDNFITVSNVVHDYTYTFMVTAHNKYGSSSPSARQTLFIRFYERNVHLYLYGNHIWIEQGQPATLVCVKSGFDPNENYTVEWFFNNRRKLNNTGKMKLLLPSVDPAQDEGSYTCTVTDSTVSSSGSLFLPIKYASKFKAFEEQNAYPDNNESAKVACLFNGIPDSDPNGWMKNRNQLAQEGTKYTMTRQPNYRTGITAYRLQISDVTNTDYGLYSLTVSNAYGTAECQTNLTNPYNTPATSSVIPDIKQCCAKNYVSPFCQQLCGFHVNVTEIVGDSRNLQCLQYFKTYVACGADGRDHSECCKRQGVLPLCIPLCNGIVPPELDNSPKIIQCVMDYSVIFSCAQEGHLLLPYTPENITLSYKIEDRSISVHWSEPHHSQDKVEHYNIFYNYSGSSIPKSVTVSGSVTVYYIMNVQSHTIYNVWMTAGNQNGNSQPTTITMIDTTSDTFIVISEEQNSNKVAIGVGVSVAIVAIIAIIVLVLFVYKSRWFPSRSSDSVTFENPSFGNQGQVKIQGAEEQYQYGRLHEDPVLEQPNVHDSSSSTTDSSHDNPMYNLQQPSNAVATLPIESHS